MRRICATAIARITHHSSLLTACLGRVFVIAAVVLAASLLTGCDKIKSQLAAWRGDKSATARETQPKTASQSTAKQGDTNQSNLSLTLGKPGAHHRSAANLLSLDLGTLTLTNHTETCVALGGGKACVFTPKMINSHDVQLTLAVESKNEEGKIHDLSIAQVVTSVGKPLEVAVGDYSLSLTPNVASE
jgi:outer membrane murein-binding lipoprotein Lpp